MLSKQMIIIRNKQTGKEYQGDVLRHKCGVYTIEIDGIEYKVQYKSGLDHKYDFIVARGKKKFPHLEVLQIGQDDGQT